MTEILSILVFFIGFYGLITGKSIIKSIVSIGVMEVAIVVFLINIGFSSGMQPPIGTSLTHVADPLPQSMVITSIIIGVAVTAINLTMLLSLCRQFESTDWDIIKKRNSE